MPPTGPERAREPSMTDVAARAGVSHQTVSRVLNGHPHVREHTRLRVLAAIEELGYRPNRAARALATGRAQSLGLISLGSTLFGPSSMQVAFVQAADAAGFDVSVAVLRALDAPAVAAAVDGLLAQRVAGIVVLAPVRSTEQALDSVDDDVPLVVVDGARAQGWTLATVDQREGARLATQHLLDLGHATVWHVSGPADWFDSLGRLEGWRDCLAAAGAEPPPLLQGDWTARSGYEAGRIIAGMPEATAVFAANDHMALGLMRAIAENGRRVPEDVSVVGFDDVPEAAYLRPPLTTVRQDFVALASDALALLLLRIEGAESGEIRAVRPELVVRESTARRAM